MNALVRKEIRLLLPAWIAVVVVAMLPLLVQTFGDEDLFMICFGGVALFLGLTPFGQELNWGTFGLLLAQPQRRERVWSAKAGLSALCFSCGWVVFNYCHWLGVRHVGMDFPGNPATVTDTAVSSALLALVAYSGGLWTTLLLRDVAAALFTTIITPVVIYEGIVVGIGWATDWAEPIAVMALVVYAIAGIVVARRLYLRAQDLPWTGGQISLAEGKGKSFRWVAFGFQKQRNKWVALVYKELQLQEITMVLVPILVVLQLLTMAVRHFAALPSDVKEYLNFIVYVWLVVPLVIGCVPVAEERRHNTWGNALCLPAAWHGQLAVKFGVTMVLGTLLGGVLPALLEGSSRAEEFIHLLPLVAAAVTAVSFLASTMSRGMLQSFTVAALLTVAEMVLFVIAVSILERAMRLNPLTCGGALFPLVMWPAGISVYMYLAVKNGRQLQTGLRLWLRNIVWLAVVSISTLAATAAIYERPWEYVMPLEPGHRVAQLHGTIQPKIAVSGIGQYVHALLPDGRLWSGHANLKGHALAGGFEGGSNWVDVAGNTMAEVTVTAMAIKADGTLWKFSRNEELAQIGTDSDWKKVVAARGGYYAALKSNGQVWIFSTLLKELMSYEPSIVRSNSRGRAAPRSLESIQIGQDGDWADVFAVYNDETVLVNKDGTLWGWKPAEEYSPDGRPMTNRLARLPDFNSQTKGSELKSLAASWNLKLGIRNDGALWVGENNLDVPSGYAKNRAKSLGMSYQTGTKKDWADLSSQGFAALETDGTFWMMEPEGAGMIYRYGWSGEMEGRTFKGIMDMSLLGMRQPSRYHDWVAVTGEFNTRWAMARDGTISCWQDPFINIPMEEGSGGRATEDWIKLRPSRRPLASVNIFDPK